MNKFSNAISSFCKFSLNRIKRMHVGFYLMVIAFACTIAAMITYTQTYNVFGYKFNRWVFLMTFLAMWCMLFMLVNTFIVGDKPKWVSYLYIVISFTLVLSVVQFINPCLSPIGIYFTVNMGNMDVNKIGVPKAILTAIFYMIAIFCNLIASFTPAARKEGK